MAKSTSLAYKKCGIQIQGNLLFWSVLIPATFTPFSVLMHQAVGLRETGLIIPFNAEWEAN